MFQLIKDKINERIANINTSTAVSIAASICNHDTFSPLKCVNAGKDVALCGAGPSFVNYKPIEGALHVALNRALLNEKVRFDCFIADDWDGIRIIQKELLDYNCLKLFGHQIGIDYKRQIPESFRIDCGAKRYYTDSYYLGGYRSRFVCDIDKMAIGNMPNIALSAMQIILFTRPKTVYLVGCDASDSGHFIKPKSETIDATKQYNNDNKVTVSGNRVIEKWVELKRFAQAFYPDTKIVSINPVGLKGLFEDSFQ